MASITATQFLNHPPSRVWRALTNPGELAGWLMPNDFRLVVGHKFALETQGWGATRCEVLAIEPERLLRYAWRNPPLDTVVEWRLEPEGDGTRLFLEHSGFDLDDAGQRRAFDGMNAGWGQIVGERLPRTLGANG